MSRISTLWRGVEQADSIVFNPYNGWAPNLIVLRISCAIPMIWSVLLAIQPEYPKTHGQDGLINYSEWSVPLGRRFRALKIWFLLRSYGLDNLRERIRNHVNWSEIVDNSVTLQILKSSQIQFYPVYIPICPRHGSRFGYFESETCRCNQ